MCIGLSCECHAPIRPCAFTVAPEQRLIRKTTRGARGFFPTACKKQCANKCLLHVTSDPTIQLTRELLTDPLAGVEARVETCSSQPGHRLTSRPAKQAACSHVNQVTG
jgi:hypothetical protein